MYLLVLFPGLGGPCWVGYYCPAGTETPILCPPGSFSNETGLAECHGCPAGYYCPLGADTYEIYPCPQGHYCPDRTTQSDEFPCPAGTFYNSTGARNESDCLPCTLGSYCELDGLAEPTGLCSAGKLIRMAIYLLI